MSARSAYAALCLCALTLLASAGAVAGYLGIPGAHAGVVTSLESGPADGLSLLTTDLHCGPLPAPPPAQIHSASPAELALAGLLSAMLLAGLLAATRMTWATRRALGDRPSDGSRRPGVPSELRLGANLASLAAELDLTGRLQLREDPAAYSYCHGLLRPRIVISRGLVEALDRQALRAVVAHEGHHLRAGDPLRGALSGVLAALAFPLPMVAGLRRVYLEAREIEADRAALALAGRPALVRALLVALRQPGASFPHQKAALASFQPDAGRLAHLVEPETARGPRLQPRCILQSLLVVAGLAALILPSLTSPVHARPRRASHATALECPLEAAHCENWVCRVECRLRGWEHAGAAPRDHASGAR